MHIVTKKKVKKKATTDDATFEETLGQLEQIVVELESGELGLSDALSQYEQGVRHLKTCQAQLDRAERTIELLSGVDANGNPITEPFDDGGDESLAEKSAARGQRRTSSAGNRGRTGNADVDAASRLF
jgi:exodeoxyribonuclease VII small subunit